MRMMLVITALVAVGLLSGCGRREPERAEGGAAAGAASGATVGLVGGPVGVVVGGAVGAVAGAGTGAATKPKDVNMGAPPWHDNSQTGREAAAHMAH
jgi:phage tail tape-measure protein